MVFFVLVFRLSVVITNFTIYRRTIILSEALVSSIQLLCLVDCFRVQVLCILPVEESFISTWIQLLFKIPPIRISSCLRTPSPFQKFRTASQSNYKPCGLEVNNKYLQISLNIKFYIIQMNFSYQNYVKRFQYQPYQWPPDIALAELHSRCSEPGPVNPKGVSCPCCGYQIKKKLKSWFKRNVYEDFKQSGAGIPAYFGLQRFYTCVVIVVLLISAYSYYAAYYTCNTYSHPPEQICVQIGEMKYIDYRTMSQTLKTNPNNNNMVKNLQLLQSAIFYILLLANNISIFYLAYIEKRCKKIKRSKQKYLSLLVQNLPTNISQQQLIKLLTLKGQAAKIKKVVFLKEIKNYANLFQQRIEAYYQLQALQIECINPKFQKKLNQKLLMLDAQYRKTKSIQDIKNQKAIIMFQVRQELEKVHKRFKLKETQKWWFALLSIFQGKNAKIPIFTSHVPEIQQTLWLNIGQNHSAKMVYKIKTIFIWIVLLFLSYALLYYPLKFSLTAKISQATQIDKMTLLQKFLPGIISIAMTAITINFRGYMQKLADIRNPKTYLQRSQFVLVTTVMFHLVFFLLIPTYFFSFPNGINESIKLFAISEQARTFIIVQLILSFIDIVYRIWNSNKIACLSNQREAFKYPQKYLHEKVQYREFPLELKLIIMFKIWSFVLFYSFFMPYITAIIAAAMIILYFLEKRNLYHHYTQRRYLGIQLEIKFLNIYINFFCVYLCVIYCFNVDSQWQIYWAVGSTIVSIIFQFLYWQFHKNSLNRIKQKQLLLISKLKQGQVSQTNKIREELLKQYNEMQQQDQKTYQQAYNEYLSQFRQKKVDEEIQQYITTLQNSKENRNSEHEE